MVRQRRWLFIALPWLSLAWGVFSVSLISHNSTGIHKVLIFMALFALAGVLGFFLNHRMGRWLSWLTLASQQAALQFILFFALPLLWRAGNHLWLGSVSLLAFSTLWDPWFNRLWHKAIYRLALTLVCFSIVSSLLVVTWFPAHLDRAAIIFPLVCLASLVSVAWHQKQEAAQESHSHSFPQARAQLDLKTLSAVLLLLVPLMFWVPAKLPAVGVWVAEGEILFHDAEESVECVSRIGAPQGFSSEVYHRWQIAHGRGPADVIKLPPVVGNGIDEKPYTTRSRKKAFATPYASLKSQRIECLIELPGMGRIGKVIHLPKVN